MVRFNPYSYEFHDDPFPVYRRLRDDEPCYHDQELGFWALSRYADVLDALHDPETYCSRFGITLEEGNPLPMMLTTDPPEHTALRRMVSRAFTPRRIADLEPSIRTLSGRYLDELRDRDTCDLIGDYAAMLPMDVISDLLGVPDGDQEQLRKWSDALLHREEGDKDVTPAGVEAAYQLFKYFTAFVADKRTRRDDDDLAAALIAIEAEGEQLTEEQVVGFLFLLIIAGNETTTKLLGNCLLALQRFPGERAKVLADRARVPDAVEEILRFEGSTQVMARTLTRDVELHGTVIPEGQRVILITASAVHDERKYPDPELFDIHRDIDRHVSFGFGRHLCLGAALARLETRVAFEELLKRFPDFTFDETGVERAYSSNIRGLAKLPLRVERRASV